MIITLISTLKVGPNAYFTRCDGICVASDVTKTKFSERSTPLTLR